MRRAAAAAVVFLLLTAAAGTSASLSPATWLHRWQSWVQTTEEGVSGWWRHPRTGPAPLLPHKGSTADGQAAVLHVSLELPNHQLLDVHEDSSLEDLVNKLLAGQAGPLPTGLELEVVQRTSHQRTSRLRTATAGLAKHASDWLASHLPQAAGGELLMPARQLGPQQQHQEASDSGGGSDSTPGSANQLRQPAITSIDSTPLPSHDQRLPLAAFDDAYLDAEASPADLPRRHLQQSELEGEEAAGMQAAAAAAEHAEESGETGWPAVTLFGPGRASLQQQLRRGEAASAAAAGVSPGDTAGGEAEAGDGEAPLLVVRVSVLARPQQPAQHHVFQLRYGGAAETVTRMSLLRRLVLASREAARKGAALGRLGAGGDDGTAALLASLRSTLAAAAETAGAGDDGDIMPAGQPQWELAPLASAAAAADAADEGAITIETVDDMFCGALMLACMCVVLLVADIRRHGWRRLPAQPASPAVVVAADETSAPPCKPKLPV